MHQRKQRVATDNAGLWPPKPVPQQPNEKADHGVVKISLIADYLPR